MCVHAHKCAIKLEEMRAGREVMWEEQVVRMSGNKKETERRVLKIKWESSHEQQTVSPLPVRDRKSLSQCVCVCVCVPFLVAFSNSQASLLLLMVWWGLWLVVSPGLFHTSVQFNAVIKLSKFQKWFLPKSQSQRCDTTPSAYYFCHVFCKESK